MAGLVNDQWATDGSANKSWEDSQREVLAKREREAFEGPWAALVRSVDLGDLVQNRMH